MKTRLAKYNNASHIIVLTQSYTSKTLTCLTSNTLSCLTSNRLSCPTRKTLSCLISKTLSTTSYQQDVLHHSFLSRYVLQFVATLESVPCTHLGLQRQWRGYHDSQYSGSCLSAYIQDELLLWACHAVVQLQILFNGCHLRWSRQMVQYSYALNLYNRLHCSTKGICIHS